MILDVLVCYVVVLDGSRQSVSQSVSGVGTISRGKIRVAVEMKLTSSHCFPDPQIRFAPRGCVSEKEILPSELN